MIYVVYWQDKDEHIRTALYKTQEKAIKKVQEEIGRCSLCGINCHDDFSEIQENM